MAMALREFRDRTGVAWRVWETTPQRIHMVSAAGNLLGAFQHGWLTFTAGDVVKRLAPVPPNWSALPDEELERLCQQAQAPRHRAADETPSGAFKRTAEHVALTQQTQSEADAKRAAAGPVRRFMDPTGREWRAGLLELPAGAEGAGSSPGSVLRFVSEDAVLHLDQYPDVWRAVVEEGLVMLLRQARVAWTRDEERPGMTGEQPTV